MYYYWPTYGIAHSGTERLNYAKCMQMTCIVYIQYRTFGPFHLYFDQCALDSMYIHLQRYSIQGELSRVLPKSCSFQNFGLSQFLLEGPYNEQSSSHHMLQRSGSWQCQQHFLTLTGKPTVKHCQPDVVEWKICTDESQKSALSNLIKLISCSDQNQ